jgi:hypothetical protein
MSSTSSQGRTSVGITAILLFLLLIACALVGPVRSASADSLIAPEGSEGGEVFVPVALAVDPTTGTLFVADRGNRRVDVFSEVGSFLRAFGWGVVASGPGNDPKNEIQEVEVSATSGSFTLLFVQIGEDPIGLIKQQTGSIPFNATAGAVQVALENLAAIEPGDVAVTGPPGGPWTIEFTGALGDADLHQLEEGEASNLAGGEAKLDISTLQEGANEEVCESPDVCREGQWGVEPGHLNPASVAVDPATHDVYVFDGLETSSHNEPPNHRVQRFTPEGEFVYMIGGGVNTDTGEDLCTATSGDTCGRGAKGSGPGEFDSGRSSVAVGPGGVLYVNDGGRVQKFDSSGALLGEVALPGVSPAFLAVDSAGNIYATTDDEVRKYSPTGTLLFTLPLSNINGIAVDSSDRLYVSNLSSGEFGITRFSPAGSPEVVFYSVTASRATAVAPSKDGTGVFTIENEKVNFIPFPEPGPVVFPVPDSVFADPIGNVKATLHSRINPEGKATTFHFQYVEQKFFEEEGGWASPEVRETDESGSIGSDFNLHDVEAPIGCADPATETSKCLTPKTEYRFRVVATNADGEDIGPEDTFTTEDSVKFGPLWTTDVETDAATLHAEVNPLGFAAQGYFEYVDDATYQSSGFDNATKTTSIDFGSGEEFVEGSAPASGLDPDTLYRYRLVVTNNCKPAEPAVVCTFESDEATFITFEDVIPPSCPATEALRSEESRLLLDCRAYEMVSPVDKNGANIEVVFNNPGYWAELNQSSLAGGKISYSAYRAFANPKGAPYSSQYLAERSSDGWQTESISPPREGPSFYTTNGLEYQYKGFTEDLCYGWVLQDTLPLLTSDAIPDSPNLYKRDNCDAGRGSYEAITKVPPIGESDTVFYPELREFSPDGSKTFFSVEAKLTPESNKDVFQTYEAGGDDLKPVCILPEGNATLSGCALGTGSTFGYERNANTATAVSDDGSVAYWTNAPRLPGPLYVRVDSQETILVSAQASQFWMAAADGSKAIYAVGDKLFEFNLSSKSSKLIVEGFKGMAGASEDASRLYLASTKALASGATAGQTNLYRYADGTFRFIGTLVGSDVLLNRPSPIADRPYLRTSRVTPDGETLVFMSRAKLTGYDNTDAVSGEADAEVFLYDASADGGEGELLCISCNPSGSRPSGSEWEVRVNVGGWAAAFIPGWITQLYASRIVSDDGNRVFFNSFDRLVGRDTNGELDVYQWEAPGTGNCVVDGSFYVDSAAGCVNLVSTGESPEPSEFVDASASGDDAFFKTYESLVPQDPGLLDIYDARVGGGFPVPAPTPEECKGESCQAPPQPEPAHPTPQSQTFVGPGDPVVKPKPRPKKCPKGKHRVKRKGKVICVKNKKRSQKRNSGRAGK